jgi:hypothetical protein
VRFVSAAACGVLLSICLAGCSRQTPSELTVTDGDATTRFVVKGAFAEYVELPGDRNELRLALADHPISCERWLPPKDGENTVTVVLVLPSDARPAVATYGWTGLPPPEEPLKAPYALPKAQLGGRSRLFEPGGSLRLSVVQLDVHGTVSGTLAFEFPGQGERPATRLDGNFEAKMCRYAPAPH